MEIRTCATVLQTAAQSLVLRWLLGRRGERLVLTRPGGLAEQRLVVFRRAVVFSIRVEREEMGMEMLLAVEVVGQEVLWGTEALEVTIPPVLSPLVAVVVETVEVLPEQMPLRTMLRGAAEITQSDTVLAQVGRARECQGCLAVEVEVEHLTLLQAQGVTAMSGAGMALVAVAAVRAGREVRREAEDCMVAVAVVVAVTLPESAEPARRALSLSPTPPHNFL